MKPSPRNARALQLLDRTGCPIYVEQRSSWQKPVVGEGGSEARLIGLDIDLERRNVEKMLRAGWLEVFRKPEDQWEPLELRITEAGRAVLRILQAEDFQPRPPDLTAQQIKAMLREWYSGLSGWLFLTELQVDGRGLDSYALGLWGATRYLSVGFEIKVSRADFLRELRQPEKRAVALRHCHQFYYVGPRGVVSRADLPEEAGLVEFWKDKSRHVVVDAPVREVAPPSWALVGRIALRTAREYHRRYDWAADSWVGEDRPIPEEELEAKGD